MDRRSLLLGSAALAFNLCGACSKSGPPAPGTVPAGAPSVPIPIEAEGASGADSVLIAAVLIAKGKGNLAEVERLKGVLTERGIPIPKSV